MINKLVMWLCHVLYKRTCDKSRPVMYLKGTGKDYPRFMLYTEDKHVYERMEDF